MAHRRLPALPSIGRGLLTCCLASVLVTSSAVAANAFWTRSYRGSVMVEGATKVHIAGYRQLGQLAPGEDRVLALQLRNDSDVVLVVDPAVGLETLPSGGATGCPASAMTVSPVDPAADVLPPNGSMETRLTVVLRDDAPEACQGTTLPVRLTLRLRTP